MGSVACNVTRCLYNNGVFCKKIVTIINNNGQCNEMRVIAAIPGEPFMEGYTKVAAASPEADKERQLDAAEEHPSRIYQEEQNIDLSKEEENVEDSEKVEEDNKKSREDDLENNKQSNLEV